MPLPEQIFIVKKEDGVNDPYFVASENKESLVLEADNYEATVGTYVLQKKETGKTAVSFTERK